MAPEPPPGVTADQTAEAVRDPETGEVIGYVISTRKASVSICDAA